MYQLDQSPGRTVWANGKEYLFFSGYSYLGMSHVPDFIKLVKEGMDKFGILHPSSRISNTRLAIYQQFEDMLSLLTGTQQTVTFSSGYLAGRAVADLCARHYEIIFNAPGSHPAIECGKPLPSEDWKLQLIKTINRSEQHHFVLFMDAVNPLSASVANFSFLHEINPAKKLLLVVDDSHGIGLLGPAGNGISHMIPRLHNVEVVITYSLSKAFHISGGAVSCSKHIANLLSSSPFYTGATAISPALSYAFVHGQQLYAKQLEHLHENIASFIKVTADIGGLCFYPSLPIFVMKPEWDARFFDAQNIIISSFAYPDPSGNKVNRIILNALHTPADLFKLSCVINQLHQKSIDHT